MITVVGLGYVGLTTAVGLADSGLSVVGYDIDSSRLDRLRDGEVPVLEPGLKDGMRRSLGNTLHLVDNPAAAYEESEVVIYCVGTPAGEDGNANLGALLAAVEETLSYGDAGRFRTLVVKSTVPPGTTKGVVQPLIEGHRLQVGVDVGLACNPEFLREGKAWQDFTHPDRIVVGADDERSRRAVSQVYESFEAPIHAVSTTTAEFVKYLSNTLLATMISFSNEMSMIADAVGGVELSKAFHILHEDRRWTGSPANMASYVYPGCGFGGYCLPKDTMALAGCARKLGIEPVVLESVLKVNATIQKHVVDQVAQVAGKDGRIAVLGLAFKPETDDVRDTPARGIIESLLNKGYRNIIAYDPVANESFDKAFKLEIAYAASVEQAVQGSDVAILLTAWQEFKEKRAFLETFQVLDFRYFLDG